VGGPLFVLSVHNNNIVKKKSYSTSLKYVHVNE